MKICILSGTHREGSYTFRVSSYIHRILSEKKDITSELFSLRDISADILLNSGLSMQTGRVAEAAARYIQPMDGLIFVVPEYNGSFPGIVKTWIDVLHPSFFWGKAVMLIGVSSGRAGNLRGLEHLSGICQHLKMHVYHFKLPISRIEEIWKNHEPDKDTREAIKNALNGFTDFIETISKKIK